MRQGDGPSLAGRALLALGLMVGFYLLAVGLAAGLLWIPWAEWNYAHRIHFKLAILCVIGAGLILWSILPRPDTFEAPGPQLTPERQPRLFAEIREIARLTGQPMPAEVYAVGDVNAWVGQRGGFLGLGSRRIMGLGVPLMRVLRTVELRAVLAHEFGHFHGGDTALGPLIYRTREAIGRTISTLAERESLMHFPFLWYGKLFLRTTHAISRRQEFAADRLAAETVGAAPLASGLRRTHGAAVAFPAYWQNEVLPVLSAGYRPPIVEGFAQFLGASDVAAAIAEDTDRALADAKTDPYDTHPPLPERIAAIGVDAADGAGAAGAAGRRGGLAIELLDDVERVERDILAAMADAVAVSRLRSIEWSDAGRTVYVPGWRRVAQEHASALTGIAIESAPEVMTGAGFAARFRKPSILAAPDADRERAVAAVGAAIAVTLADAGVPLDCMPGEPIGFAAGERRENPFDLLARLEKGETTAADWRAFCVAAGVAGKCLGTAGESGTTPAR